MSKATSMLVTVTVCTLTVTCRLELMLPDTFTSISTLNCDSLQLVGRSSGHITAHQLQATNSSPPFYGGASKRLFLLSLSNIVHTGALFTPFTLSKSYVFHPSILCTLGQGLGIFCSSFHGPWQKLTQGTVNSSRMAFLCLLWQDDGVYECWLWYYLPRLVVPLLRWAASGLLLASAVVIFWPPPGCCCTCTFPGWGLFFSAGNIIPIVSSYHFPRPLIGSDCVFHGLWAGMHHSFPYFLEWHHNDSLGLKTILVHDVTAQQVFRTNLLCTDDVARYRHVILQGGASLLLQSLALQPWLLLL